MAPQTPYSHDLGDREPIAAMREATEAMRALMSAWTPLQFERTYAPGKWTARQILVHLAQTELALGNRVRMALATPNYAAQAFDQDRWMEIEGGTDGTSAAKASTGEAELSGRAALEALLAVNVMNCALFSSLPASARAAPFSHPEYGSLTVDWIIHQMAGHMRHHLEQLEIIARQQAG
jgi:hypothetical protein